MRKFSKQLVLLALGMILSSVAAFPAYAVTNPDCPGVATGPLTASTAYSFYASGNDDTFSHNATVTLVGSIYTDASGCPQFGYFAVNDNGFPCEGTLSSVLTSSGTYTGTLTWTSACFSQPLVLNYDSANPFSQVLYFSSQGGQDFALGGKVQIHTGIDGGIIVPGAGTVAVLLSRKHKHHN